MTTSEGNTTQLTATRGCSIINMPFIKQNSTIERVNDNGNKFDKVDVVDVNSIKVSNLAKFKDLI